MKIGKKDVRLHVLLVKFVCKHVHADTISEKTVTLTSSAIITLSNTLDEHYLRRLDGQKN